MLISDWSSDVCSSDLGGMTKGRKTKVGCAVHELDAEGSDQLQAERLADKQISKIRLEDEDHELNDGSVVIAAITSCTHTSNQNRKSVVSGKSQTVRLDLGGCSSINKKK